MKLLIVTLVTWFVLLTGFTLATATADEQGAGSSGGGSSLSISSDPEDPGNPYCEEQKSNNE